MKAVGGSIAREGERTMDEYTYTGWSTGEAAGRVYYEDGAAITHCDAESGHERWRYCQDCGRRIVYCFECGSVDRKGTECECSQQRSH